MHVNGLQGIQPFSWCRGAVAALAFLALTPGSAAAKNPTPPGPEFRGQPAEYASAFAAKEICSRVLIAGQDPEPIIGDLREASALAPGFAIDSAKIDIDRANRIVTVHHPGQPPRSAVQAKSQGCVILPAYDGRLHFKPRWFPWGGGSANEPWPGGEQIWQGKSNINRAALDAALEAYVHRPGMRGVVVVHKGELVGESYAPGFGPFVQQRSWSVAKSITSTLAGLMVDRGALRLDGRPPIAEWAHDARRAITLRNLMNMSSGLKQNQFEGTARSLETFTPQSEHAFIYFDGFDTYADALEAPLEVPPGSRFQYRNANVLAVAYSVRRAVRRRGGDPQSFPQRKLLEPLGMRTTTLETDPYGHFIASGTAFTTPRDLARLGLLYLQGGSWNGGRFLSQSWVDFVRTPGPMFAGYGGFFWLNHDSSPFRSLPPDVYFADGAFGQNVIVIPSHDVVIARMGWNAPDDHEGLNAFARGVLTAVELGGG
jgi:CubicO group peptidase (beta-lactamase class C family)